MCRIKNFAKIFLLVAILATLVFIFVQSMLPPETSDAESNAVGEIIEEIISSDTPAGSYIQTNLRKIAHFVEFALLGAELALYLVLFTKRKLLFLISYPVALITALFDESIQMFSDRGPAIFDVWIDFFGFFVTSSIVYAVFFVTSYFLKRRTLKRG